LPMWGGCWRTWRCRAVDGGRDESGGRLSAEKREREAAAAGILL
jgi:hypothetical protein